MGVDPTQKNYLINFDHLNMPTTPQNHPRPSVQEKRRLRRQVRQSAQGLLDSDNIASGAEVLADLRQRHGTSNDNYLRYGLAVIFMEHLMRHCCGHQSRKVAYLMDEHLAEFGGWKNSRILMMAQLAMWRRFRNSEAEESCFLVWQAKNTSRHDQS